MAYGIGQASPMAPAYLDEYRAAFDAIATGTPLADLAERVAQINRNNGWYDLDRSFGDDIALLHSEVSEAYEEYRKGHVPAERYYTVTYRPIGPDGEPVLPENKPEGVPSELADILIRLLDTAYRYGIDLDDAVEEKLAYNATRGYRHGNKVV